MVQKADSFNNGAHLCVGDFYPKNGKWTDATGDHHLCDCHHQAVQDESEQGATSCGGSTLHQEQHSHSQNGEHGWLLHWWPSY
jgi:hypothetical protein